MLVIKMNKKIKDEREVSPIKLFVIMLPSMPSLMIKISRTFLSFKRNANKAGRVFKKELIKQGIDKQTAIELTEVYMQGSHIRKYIQSFT
jgi:hypothetical protein